MRVKGDSTANLLKKTSGIRYYADPRWRAVLLCVPVDLSCCAQCVRVSVCVCACKCVCVRVRARRSSALSPAVHRHRATATAAPLRSVSTPLSHHITAKKLSRHDLAYT